jgi:hypothetical protein
MMMEKNNMAPEINLSVKSALDFCLKEMALFPDRTRYSVNNPIRNKKMFWCLGSQQIGSESKVLLIIPMENNLPNLLWSKLPFLTKILAIPVVNPMAPKKA